MANFGLNNNTLTAYSYLLSFAFLEWRNVNESSHNEFSGSSGIPFKKICTCIVVVVYLIMLSSSGCVTFSVRMTDG